MYYMAKFAWWYGMFQYVRSVRVECVVRVSSVTTLCFNHWKGFEDISLADRQQTDRQIYIFQKRDSFLQTEKCMWILVILQWTVYPSSPPRPLPRIRLCTVYGMQQYICLLGFVICLRGFVICLVCWKMPSFFHWVGYPPRRPAPSLICFMVKHCFWCHYKMYGHVRKEEM